MRKSLLIAFAIIFSLTACTNRPVFWLPPEIFNPDPEPVEECKHINLKDVSAWFDDETSGHYPKTGICADCGEEIKRDSIEIGTADQLLTLGNDLSANNDIGYYTISIIDDIDMTGKTWPYIYLNGSKTPYNKKNFVINGNGHSIKGLTINDNDLTITDIRGIGFISRTWSAVTLEIKDLTLIDANISASAAQDGPSLGGFVGWIEANEYVKISNCHVIESEFSGGHRAGGIYGYAAGYSGQDGPVLTKILIEGCSVENTVFESSDASIGGIIGHAGGNKNTEISVSNSSVTGCTITSDNGGDNKIGNILGTNGVGKTTLTTVTFSGNTLNGNSSDKYCGRTAFDKDGSLTIDTVPVEP